MHSRSIRHAENASVTRFLVVVVLAAVALCAMPALAYAAAPVGTAVTPMPLSQGTAFSPAIRADFVAADGATLRSSATVFVDGTPYPATLTWAVGGYWAESDGYPYWVEGTDATRGSVNLSSALVGDGVHTVRVVATDTLGRNGEVAWTFSTALPALLSAPTPAVTGDVATAKPTFAASVAAASGLAMTMTVDGVRVTPLLNSLPGRASYTPSVPLADGVYHDVTLAASDKVGRSATVSWHVKSAYGANVSLLDRSIADGAILETSTANLAFRIQVPAGVGSRANVTLDGITRQITLLRESPTVARGVFIASGLPDGLHSLRVVGFAADTTNKGFDSSFSVAVPPAITAVSPSGASLVTSLTAPVSATVVGNGAVSGSFTVNGAEFPAVSANGTLIASGLTLENDRTYDVTVTAVGGSGASSRRAWAFSTLAQSSGTISDCSGCHRVAAHPMRCNACHHWPGDNTPADCSTCHGTDFGHGTEKLVGQCTNCHGSRANVPFHGVEITPLHKTSSNVDSCKPCHLSHLDVEHAQRADANGTPYNCATCHQSTNPSVTAAIAAKSTACSACHSANSLRHVELHDSTLSADCTGCHTANLVVEHSNRNRDCEACHASVDPKVTAAIASGNRNCDACHTLHGAGADLCYGCHTAPSASGAYPGKAVAAGSKHMSTASSSVAATAWPGLNPSTPCLNCHDGHNGDRAAGNSLCYTCHDAAGTTKPVTYSYRSQTAFLAGAHGSKQAVAGATGLCTTCHAVHDAAGLADTAALKTTEAEGCLGCHNQPANSVNGVNIAAKFSGGANASSRHDSTASDQAATGSKTPCSACHSVHADTPTAAFVNPDNLGQQLSTSADVFEPARKVAPNTFCLACHDGSLPAGVTSAAPMKNISSAWVADVHGASYSQVPAGTMAAPYLYNTGAIACETCHDTHGSSNQLHFPTTINGSTGIAVADATQWRQACFACHKGGATSETAFTAWHNQPESTNPDVNSEHGGCISCHSQSAGSGGTGRGNVVLNPNADCSQCHTHGKVWSHPRVTWGNGCYCHATGTSGVPASLVYRTF